MARTALTPTALTPNAGLIDITYIACATDGFAVPPTAWPQGSTPEELFLHVKASGALVVTVVAGDDPPALEAGQGNYAETLAINEEAFIGPFTSARFAQHGSDVISANGEIWVNCSTTNGTIAAVHVPRTA